MPKPSESSPVQSVSHSPVVTIEVPLRVSRAPHSRSETIEEMELRLREMKAKVASEKRNQFQSGLSLSLILFFTKLMSF